ncbi:MAG: TonB-dependent receptor [Cytophagales bacterium]|nr:TonB-dependent receptor [Cytophagales bacterium]
MRTLLIVLFLLPTFCFAQKFTISGYVRDAETGENLIGATVYDLKSKSGTVTNIYGFFSLTLPSDSVALRTSFVGYQVQESAFYLSKDQVMDFSLESGELLDEVVVTAEEAIELLPQMSTVTVPMEQLKQVPVLLGETDILKTIQLLPGIQGGNEGASGVYVRGGGPDQNLILIDGVPVYNANHLFGFFSVFNADAINNVSVVKGGFPARYGGRLSSVIDISMKEGNNQKISGKGSVGLISSKFTLEGPIKNENTSFILSARRTYIDILTRPIIKASSDGDVIAGYFFEDFNAKINHRFSRKDRLYLSFYGGKDKFYFRDRYASITSNDEVLEESEDEGGLKWGNLISAIRWNHLYSPKLFSNVTATFSRYRFDVFSNFKQTAVGEPTEEERIRYLSGIEDMAIKVDFDYLPTTNHNIKFGASVINHAFRPGVFSYKSEVEADTTFGARTIKANELSAYIEDDFQIGDKLRFNAGLHGSMFFVRGESFLSLQPRISARYLLGQDISLKASYAEMRQFIHLLSNSGVGLPTDLWVPATDLVKPQESRQVAVGVAKSIQGFEISLESYYKEMDNLIEYLDGASFFNTDDDWEDKVAAGSGTSYGTEFLIQKKTGRLTGWIGYTWSKTTRQFDDLNFGKEYPYKYDRRHDLSVVSVYQLNDRISISGTWVYGTGNAISLPESTFQNFDPTFNSFFSQGLDYYGSRNNYRMRDYHRLDVGISMSKQKRRGVRTWSFGAYNLYSRRNPFYIDTRSTGDGQQFVQTSLFPIIPYLTYSFEF